METKVIVYDFSELASVESAEALKVLLEKELANVDLSILVNNVGCAKFATLDKHTIWDSMRQINVNINSQTYMSMFLLPKLLGRDSRSAMINISSVAAYSPGGSLPIYCASKSYNWVLSECMRNAYSEQMDVLTVTPNSVRSQMNSGRYLFSISANRHASASVNQLGWAGVTYGSVVHALQPQLKAIPPIGFFVDTVNASRRAAWIKEEEAKKQAAATENEVKK